MTMKFDRLCSIVLNEAKAKAERLANLVYSGNRTIFTAEDIWKDSTDPSKGIWLYLSGLEAKKQEKDLDDPEIVSRGLRRLNWIAAKAVHKFKRRSVSVEELAKHINDLLIHYQENIASAGSTKLKKDESSKIFKVADKANTGYEIRKIIDFLLPPTKRFPSGKAIFISPGMPVDIKPEQENDRPAAARAPRAPRVPGIPQKPEAEDDVLLGKGIPGSAKELSNRADLFCYVYFDTGIENIITDYANANAKIRDILKDPIFTDAYTQDALKIKLKEMLKAGNIVKAEDGTLSVGTESGTSAQTREDVRKLYQVRGKKEAEADDKAKEVEDEAKEKKEDKSIEQKDIEDTDPIEKGKDKDDEDNPDIDIPNKPSWEKEEDEDDKKKEWYD